MDQFFSKLAKWVTNWSGSTNAAVCAFLLVIGWTIGGFFIGFDNMLYEMAINSITTVITFLMVFLIQRTQNQDGLATHVKLNEILAALKGASPKMINVEELPEKEVKQLHQKFDKLKDKDSGRHSIEEIKNGDDSSTL